MSKARPTCFISYCRQESVQDDVEKLVELFRELSSHKIDFFLDRDLPPGARISQHEEKILESDGILVLLTPEYRRRCIDKSDNGAYREYRKILSRLDEDKIIANAAGASNSERKYDHYSPVFFSSLVISGSAKETCPDEIKDILCEDFTGFRTHKNRSGDIYIPDLIKTKYSKKIREIISQICDRHVASEDQFLEAYQSTLTRLFLETKHELVDNDPQFSSIAKRISVKTHAYRLVQTQQVFMLIGRKGSGKTFISRYIAEWQENKYKPQISVNLNKFELEYLYAMLNPKNVWSDNVELSNSTKPFSLSWEAFLVICCMEVLVNEESAGRLSGVQRAHIGQIKKLLSSIGGESDTKNSLNKSGVFRWCLAKVLEYTEAAINSSRNQTANFHYDMASLFESEKVLGNIFTGSILRDLRKIFGECSKRFLVSLDGFDTALEKFRRNTNLNQQISSEERFRRTQYEIEWLRGFLHIATGIKNPDSSSILGGIIDFCITIPKERFIEIERDERDGVQYFGKYRNIRWTGIELARMLRKRLELLANIATDRSFKPHVRLEKLIQENYSHVPMVVETTVGGREYTIPIFIYVLRHTFWRPREIILYFAKVLTVLQYLKERDLLKSHNTIRKCIADATRLVIATEFFGEFQRHCTNLTTVIERFKNMKQILTFAELLGCIDTIDFQFIDQKSPANDVSSKIKFLYEIGFLGLEATDEMMNRFRLLNKDVFWFNAGDDPVELITRDETPSCKFLLHPAFCEYLNLDTSNQRMILNFDWQYLQELEAHMFAS